MQRMQSGRWCTGWLGALALVTVWWFVSLGDPPTARERAQTSSNQPQINGRVRSAFTERLKRTLANAPAAPSPRRNPFQFGTAEPTTAPPPTDAAPVAPPPPAPIVTPPAFTLAGVATSDTPDGPEHTAVVSGARGVWLVKAGDDLPTGLRVVRVGDDHVVLADAAGTETILRLK